MRIPVHMCAFGKKDDIREVTIPDDEISANATINSILDLVFKYGQNDFQPLQQASVSVGDVIEYNGKYFLIKGVGFKEISASEFKCMPDQVVQKSGFIEKIMFGD